MGTSTLVGHYVCHILKDNHWVIYNDEKVALSENPPKDLGYLYLYKRIWTRFCFCFNEKREKKDKKKITAAAIVTAAASITYVSTTNHFLEFVIIIY